MEATIITDAMTADRIRFPSAGHLLNRAAAKGYILDFAEYARPGWRCERVSKSYLDDLESRIAAMIRADIRTHPTVGRTMKP